MARNKRFNKNIVKKIANTRIQYLFGRAEEIFPDNKFLANRYVYLARKYAQRAKTRIPKKWKKRICHTCKSFLYPGLNCRIRLHSIGKRGKGSHISLTCFECNKTTRYFIK
jgi:ribonuclease P protein subunit RPR2